MLLFIFTGFLLGFLMSLRFVRRPRRTMIWGLMVGVVSLVLLLGPGNAPIQGIGSALNFAFFALGPLMLIPFVASGAALGVAGGSAVLWIGKGRARWVSWSASLALVGLVASLTLIPLAKRETVKNQLAEDRDARAEQIVRADFEGNLGGHQVAFPASPHLHLFDDCAPGVQASLYGCSTNLANPVTILTGPDEVLLHERSDPINFLVIRVSEIKPDCNLGSYCLTQEKINLWCGEFRPDQADSIWCRDTPSMLFSMLSDTYAEATASPSNREEPELAATYTDTPLGPGRVDCFYHPDRTKTDKQGEGCNLTFNLANGVKASMFASRVQITSNDPALAATIGLIPDYWAALTGGR